MYFSMNAKGWKLLVSLLLLVTGLIYAGDIYKWVDKEGRTHYSDSSPLDSKVEVEEVEVEPPPSEEATREAEETFKATLKDQEIRRQKERLEKETSKRQRSLEQGRHEFAANQCDFSKRSLITLEAHRPVYLDYRGEFHWQGSRHSDTYKGPRKHVKDEIRRSLIASFKRQIDEYCDK
jgi:hypothetical protein